MKVGISLWGWTSLLFLVKFLSFAKFYITLTEFYKIYCPVVFFGDKNLIIPSDFTGGLSLLLQIH
jgi:hypothetical protein